MNPSLHSEVTGRLLRDYAFKQKRGGEKLEAGQCPACAKKTLWAFGNAPWVLKCNRLNHCGAELHIKDIYPDLFESWSDRFKPTPENPKAAADAYMRDGRGFNLDKVRDWYTQESYYSHELKLGSATVRFVLGAGVYWERIIDQAHRFGDRKATFHGSYGGMWWQPPGLNAGSVDEIWIVEGIFDAIALWHHDIAAVAAMSCTNYPSKALAGLAEQLAAASKPRPKLVWALDADRAGTRYGLQWLRRARDEGWEASIALPKQVGTKKRDWNDLHQLGKLDAKDLDEYRYLGGLMAAPSPAEKARLIYGRTSMSQFAFDFDSKLYWFKVDLEALTREMGEVRNAHDDLTEDEIRDEAMLKAGVVTNIATCLPTVLYYQANAATDEAWYYFRVAFPHDSEPVKNTFTSSQVASATEFKKRLLAVAPGAFYTGTNAHLDSYLKEQMHRIKSVQTIDFVGYTKEHGCYVYADVAVKDGKLYTLNDEDFFDVGRQSIKTIGGSAGLSLNRDFKAFRHEWLELIWRAFGAKGIVALAFWLGSLFAEQIREGKDIKQKSFPFLEVVGEPGAGKSTLIEFLWKLCGRRDYEGFDPSKSSLAARARNFAQVSNLPVVLIEGDRGEDGAKVKGFDWNELKTAYNGRSTRARGVKNAGNETYEPPFRGTVVISQNAEVNASEAVLQRIVHLYFDRTGQNADTFAAARALEQMPVEDVSGFLLTAILKERDILASYLERMPTYQDHLAKHPEVKHQRLVKNHAQVMALVDCLGHVLPLPKEYRDAAIKQLVTMAVERQQAIGADHPLVQEFWELYDHIESADDDHAVLNHARGDGGTIAISLRHFEQVANDRRLNLPPLTDLKRVLRTSRHRKFVELRVVNSAINARHNTDYPAAPRRPTTVKCWVFEDRSGNKGA
ncbi:toprim domain-containing protein [Cupriavidus sp. amp6]|uniref:toprim domain-containing protein n=1 Tax=Cupriavidus sp. amp6 TaxID=388051 RepID=UPI00041DDFFD|nr:toprim domain-containing protein [Cupriavidus sp. amp6]